jgi:2-polyprenyl-3-methyl-5-hydroxy-6-metoxy-1,4-benzoquinol methylase
MKEYKYVRNKQYGYYQAVPTPSEDELADYYKKKYYQNERSTYSRTYMEEELIYFKNKIEQKAFVINEILNETEDRSILDIGCGEGFTLDFFKKVGWRVEGVDFSDFGIRENNPHLLENLRQGNIFEKVRDIIEEGLTFDVVWLDNVLEHVVDPEYLINQCYQLTKEGGVLVIEVPNDYSDFQKELVKNQMVQHNYWEAFPDHLSYFSFDSLKKLCETNDWKTRKIISDFPIEWFLVNSHSNYVNNSDVGKGAHKSRVFLENYLHSSQNNNLQNLISLMENMALIGQGRQLTGFFTK